MPAPASAHTSARSSSVIANSQEEVHSSNIIGLHIPNFLLPMPRHQDLPCHYPSTPLSDLVPVPSCNPVLPIQKVAHSIGFRLILKTLHIVPPTPTPSRLRPGARRLVTRTGPTSTMGKEKVKAKIQPLSRAKRIRSPLLSDQDQEEGEPELEEVEDEEEEEEEESEVEEEEEGQIQRVESPEPLSRMFKATTSRHKLKSTPLPLPLSTLTSTSHPQRRSKRLQLAPPSPPPLASSTRSIRPPSRFSLPNFAPISAMGSATGSTHTPAMTQRSSSNSKVSSHPTTPMDSDLDYSPLRPCLPFLKVEPVTLVSDLRTSHP